jgi:hypothetical protein
MPRRRLSPKLNELYEELRQTEAAKDIRRSLELLEDISFSGESAALIPIAPYLFSHNEMIAEGSARAASTLLARLPASEYFWLDEGVRSMTAEWRYNAEAGYPWLPANKVKLLFNYGVKSWAAFGHASFHINGFIREEALHHLASIADGNELPFLIIRLRDWVPEVRRVAEAAIKERIIEQYAFQWVRCLPLAYRVGQGKRYDNSLLLERVETLLLRQSGGLALMRGMSVEDTAVRRLCLRLGMDHAEIDRRMLIIMGLKDRDTTLRLMAARMVRERLGDDDKEYILPLMKANRSMAVRKEALLLALERGQGRTSVELEEALLDDRAAIRECARFYLREDGWTDFPEFYREAVKQGEKHIIPALLGLAETGNDADIELITPFASSEKPSLRKAAVRALDRLWINGGEEIFLEALRSEHSGVSRAARDALVKRLHFTTRVELREIIQGAHPSCARMNALYLMSHAERWESLACLLRSSNDNSSEIRQISIRYLERWVRSFNKSFTKPDAGLVAEIGRHLDASSGVLGEDLARHIRYLTRGW